MDGDSGSKQSLAKTTPSSHRDFFAKLYGSLEEEYNKKREFESQNSSNPAKNITILEASKNKSNDDVLKNNTIAYINAVDEDSEDDRASRNGSKGCDASLSPPISPGSSPTKDEEISPPRVPPPTLKQLQKRYEVRIIYFYLV